MAPALSRSAKDRNAIQRVNAPAPFVQLRRFPSEQLCSVQVDLWLNSRSLNPVRMISFIIPAYNEEFELPGTIATIKEAVGSRDHEIIVVNDVSTDATAELAKNAGAAVISINRRQIAAARNAGARAAKGEIFIFVDADTRVSSEHVRGVASLVDGGAAGGGARVAVGGSVPRWARILIRVFCAVYFNVNLGAGAFLFTTRQNFQAIGGFDEELFVGEEVFFSLALRKLGPFKILQPPVVTSGRKLRMYSAREILRNMFAVLLGGKRAARSRANLEIWYGGRRESASDEALVREKAA